MVRSRDVGVGRWAKRGNSGVVGMGNLVERGSRLVADLGGGLLAEQ